MAVQDDVRRLSQLDSIYLGYNTQGMTNSVTGWHKGRLQQANDGTWIFRSSASCPISDLPEPYGPTSRGATRNGLHYFCDRIFTTTITGGIDQLNFKLCEHEEAKRRETRSRREKLSLPVHQAERAGK
jgi:hypothetical protein